MREKATRRTSDVTARAPSGRAPGHEHARSELIAARDRAVSASGEAFRDMRRALGVSALDMAALLGVSAETVCRWERGHRAVSRATFALLAAIVTDAIDGRTSTVDLLRALAAPAVQVAPADRRRTRRR